MADDKPEREAWRDGLGVLASHHTWAPDKLRRPSHDRTQAVLQAWAQRRSIQEPIAEMNALLSHAPRWAQGWLAVAPEGPAPSHTGPRAAGLALRLRRVSGEHFLTPWYPQAADPLLYERALDASRQVAAHLARFTWTQLRDIEAGAEQAVDRVIEEWIYVARDRVPVSAELAHDGTDDLARFRDGVDCKGRPVPDWASATARARSEIRGALGLRQKHDPSGYAQRVRVDLW